MSYLFEQLGDERFQKLCQALIVSLYPDAQCFPVGQPDGGRDGLIRTRGAQTSNSIVFQVKYSKDPFSKSARDVIEQVISTEKEKVDRLVAKGATSYHLMTNVAGTSHYECGSIDTVNAELSRAFGIDVYCWWRDDLDRRIDISSFIKWSYPEILRATDLLGALMHSKEDSDCVRRADTLKSYMAHQARYDSQLKFKQIELERDILDLFVDVPGCFYPSLNVEQKYIQEHAAHIVDSFPEDEPGPAGFEDDGHEVDEEDVLVFPLHRLMVNSDLSKKLNNIVIEGAPGQGKSTVTQYLCQVNRILLLNKASDLRRANRAHLPKDVRIPFRIDLRDYANWLSGKNPFSALESERGACGSEAPVLESFIASQVRHCTGSSFSVDDFLAVVKISQVLIVLDGFDEVADISVRNRIVDEISYAADRISQSAISAQVIVTSRPTAFANSPGFSKSEWQHIKILPLYKSDIKKYAIRWLEGRGADLNESREVLNLLAEKLNHSHVRDLARNPMQLAILLALISVQGASLPDKRTSLYDDYIKIFLNRETEKSQVVRENRELLVQIHRYLAWVLQSEAEEKSESGNITEARLRALLKEFLDRAGHPSELINTLFTGMVERVVVLVSRVQGTFEFEVQPLREYFAARYLYDTAPYVPAGTAKKGTLPERFDAIARNFYWLNVSRFYAGCYSSGELASILDGLDDVSSSEGFKNIAHSARFGIYLLKDYVFSQSPRLANRLLDKIIDSHRFRLLLADSWMSRGASELMVLPTEALRASLSRKCVELLRDGVMFDARYSLAKIIGLNSNVSYIDEIWADLSESGLPVSSLSAIGLSLGIFERGSDEDICSFVDRYGAFVLSRMLSLQRYSLLDSEYLLGVYIERALSSNAGFFYLSRAGITSVPFPAIFFLIVDFVSSDYIWKEIIEDNGRYRYEQYEEVDFYEIYKNSVASGEVEVPKGFVPLWDALVDFMSCHAGSNAGVQAFSVVLSEALKIWGERWGLLSSSLNFTLFIDNVFLPAVDLNDAAISPVSRSQYARYAGGDQDWWRQQILIISKLDREYVRYLWACAKRWMSTPVLIELSSDISVLLESIPDYDLFEPYEVMRQYEQSDDLMWSGTDIDLLEFSDIVACLLIIRAAPPSRFALWESRFKNYVGQSSPVLELSANILFEQAVLSGIDCWEDALGFTKRLYSLGHIPSAPEALGDAFIIPLRYSEKICMAPAEYPLSLVAFAERSLSTHAGAIAKPVGLIARADTWSFLDE